MLGRTHSVATHVQWTDHRLSAKEVRTRHIITNGCMQDESCQFMLELFYIVSDFAYSFESVLSIGAVPPDPYALNTFLRFRKYSQPTSLCSAFKPLYKRRPYIIIISLTSCNKSRPYQSQRSVSHSSIRCIKLEESVAHAKNMLLKHAWVQIVYPTVKIDRKRVLHCIS